MLSNSVAEMEGSNIRLCVVTCFSNVGELFSDTMKKKDKWYFSPHNLLKISLLYVFINQIENFRDCLIS